MVYCLNTSDSHLRGCERRRGNWFQKKSREFHLDRTRVQLRPQRTLGIRPCRKKPNASSLRLAEVRRGRHPTTFIGIGKPPCLLTRDVGAATRGAAARLSGL